LDDMRIDKFLKVSRIIKRRTVAKDACEGGRVKVNGNSAKPGRSISVGDRIEIAFGNRTLEVEVKEIASHMPADEADTMYEVIREEYEDDEDDWR